MSACPPGALCGGCGGALPWCTGSAAVKRPGGVCERASEDAEGRGQRAPFPQVRLINKRSRPSCGEPATSPPQERMSPT